MKRIHAALLIALVIVASGAIYFFHGKQYEVVISQAQIDAALSKRFPMTRNYLLLIRLTCSDPEVTLLEDRNRVQVGLNVKLNVRLDGQAKELGGNVMATTGIRYDNERQEFYLDDAEFSRLEIDGIPERYQTQVIQFVTRVARECLQTRPIYRLEARDAKTSAAKMLLKDVQVRQQAIHLSLGIQVCKVARLITISGIHVMGGFVADTAMPPVSIGYIQSRD